MKTKINEDKSWQMSDIKEIEFTKNNVVIHLLNGEVVISPISRFKNLKHASHDKLNNYEVKRGSYGQSIIEWPEIGESLDLQDLDSGVE